VHRFLVRDALYGFEQKIHEHFVREIVCLDVVSEDIACDRQNRRTVLTVKLCLLVLVVCAQTTERR
jgi:hypothetical protein